mmetsp:Transcript_47742/g.72827  ORF Transcript_47742/g.72827 Transcript_47742/m.72827 type:complete len:389 (+) Transcript_47742:183-1349(+)
MGGGAGRSSGLVAAPAAVLELHAHQVPRLDLSGVVDDELVVEQRGLLCKRLRRLPHRYHHAVVHRTRAARVGGGLAVAFHRQLVLRDPFGEGGVGGVELVEVSERHLRQQQQPLGIRRRRKTVVGRLGDHVGKVDSFAEHVASDRRFGGCDAQTLGEDTDPVGDTRAVPKQLSVVVLLELLEPFVLALAGAVEGVDKLQRVVAVGLGVGVLDILFDHLPRVRTLLDRLEVGVELLVVGVQHALLGCALLLAHRHRNLQLEQRLDHLDFALELFGVVDEVNVRHSAAAEVLRHDGVELVALAQDLLLPVEGIQRLVLEDVLDLSEHVIPALDLLAAQLAQRHFVQVDFHLHHTLLHDLHVENELHEAGDLVRERRGDLLALLLLLLLWL